MQKISNARQRLVFPEDDTARGSLAGTEPRSDLDYDAASASVTNCSLASGRVHDAAWPNTNLNL